MKIIIAIIIFSAIILFHELGHFLLAKKNKIVVTEFSLGMGPRLLSTERNGTRYSLKLLSAVPVQCWGKIRTKKTNRGLLTVLR